MSNRFRLLLAEENSEGMSDRDLSDEVIVEKSKSLK